MYTKLLFGFQPSVSISELTECVFFRESSFDVSLSRRVACVRLCVERIGAKGEWECLLNPDSKPCQLSQCGHQFELVSD